MGMQQDYQALLEKQFKEWQAQAERFKEAAAQMETQARAQFEKNIELMVQTQNQQVSAENILKVRQTEAKQAVAIAQGAGIDVFQIDDPSTCGSQLDGVADHPGPILVEAVVDQFTPPMPAKIKAT